MTLASAARVDHPPNRNVSRDGGSVMQRSDVCAQAAMAALVGFSALVLTACSSSSPSEPSPAAAPAAASTTAALNLTGTWSCMMSDETGPGTFTWQLTQSAATISG